MNLLFPMVLAFAGGIVSFLSPCVFPLVPVYLSVLTGFDVATIRQGGAARAPSGAIVRDTALFVAGFTAVFVVLGSTASVVGRSVGADHQVLARVAGVLIVLMALFLAGSQLLRAPRLYREWRPRVNLARVGPFAAPLAGAAFGFAWTPCIGPILASVLGVASTAGEAGRGALLLAAYSLGLGVPFLVGGVLLGRLAAPLAWVRRHLRALTLVSAGLMLALGGLVVAGQVTVLNSATGGLG